MSGTQQGSYGHPFQLAEHCYRHSVGWVNDPSCPVDRELARFIYVREVKRFDPFKFSIYAWYIKIAIAGSLTPVRLAWMPFLRVPKKWVYLCGGRY